MTLVQRDASATMSRRPTLKVRLPSSPHGIAASDIVAGWFAIKDAARRVTRAIIIYDGLLRGDTSALLEDFPFFQAGQHTSSFTARPASTPRGKVEITHAEPEDDTAIDDLWSSFE